MSPRVNDTTSGDDSFIIQIDGILSSFKKSDIEVFVYDLFLIFHLLEILDREYWDSGNTENDMVSFKRMITDWGRKYRDIILYFEIRNMMCNIDVYLEAALEDLLPLIKKMNRFIDLEYKKNQYIEASFEEFDKKKNNTLTLRHAQDKRTRLIYAKTDMLKPYSPEFRLCTYFGMAGGFDEGFDLQKYRNEISFSSSSGRDWDRRYPAVSFQGSPGL